MFEQMLFTRSNNLHNYNKWWNTHVAPPRNEYFQGITKDIHTLAKISPQTIFSTIFFHLDVLFIIWL